MTIRLGLVVLACAAVPSDAGARSCAPVRPETVAYRHVRGAPVAATSLDLYRPVPACRRGRAPVVVWVHGGGYHLGDKATNMGDKVRLFTARGWIFVSVNYRLTRQGDATSAHWPDHYDDVAGAVAWVRRHIATRGGDARRIALLGHSAGADIVANETADPRYLRRWGLTPRAIRCQGPLDTEGFDKTRASSSAQAAWADSLGTAPDYLRTTSATLQARRGTGLPPTFTVFRGTPRRQAIERGYAQRLRALGVRVTLVDARSLTHEQVNRRLGAAGDNVVTPPLVRFLARCLG